MQWGQIKTLFILCFLLLDIYLLSLVVQQQDNQERGSTVEGKEQEEQILESENISYKDALPDPLPDERSITIQQKYFDKSEIERIKEKEGQEVEVVNNSMIISHLQEKVVIPENAGSQGIEQLVANTIYLGNEFVFEEWDKERNILIFFQKKNDRPVYYNQNGMALIFLNENDEMIAYTQSLLGTPEFTGDERSLIKPFNAIMKLYNSNLLYPKDEVKDVEIGYHTNFPLDSGLQVLVPTWKITINDSRTQFVNAIEQFVTSVNDEFVEDVLELSIENTRAIKDKEEFKEAMLDILTSKLTINRSESA